MMGDAEMGRWGDAEMGNDWERGRWERRRKEKEKVNGWNSPFEGPGGCKRQKTKVKS